MEMNLRDKLMTALPPLFTRETAAKLTGRLLAPGTLANLDCKGEGPGGKVQLGRRIGYERTSFVEWLLSRLGDPESRS
jgi:hypothetical protein